MTLPLVSAVFVDNNKYILDVCLVLVVNMGYPNANYGLSMLNLGTASLPESFVKQGRQPRGFSQDSLFSFCIVCPDTSAISVIFHDA